MKVDYDIAYDSVLLLCTEKDHLLNTLMRLRKNFNIGSVGVSCKVNEAILLLFNFARDPMCS